MDRTSRARHLRPFRPLAAAASLLVAIGAGSLGGCGSDHAFTLLESDVPAPPEMAVRHSFDIARDGGELSAGRFILAGAMVDLDQAVEETIARYSGNGWALRERRMQTAHAALTFEKGTRTAVVELIQRRVDPEMSTAVIIVGRAG